MVFPIENRMIIIGSSNWMGSLIGIPLTSSQFILLQAIIAYHFDWQCSDVCRNCGAHVMMDMLNFRWVRCENIWDNMEQKVDESAMCRNGK